MRSPEGIDSTVDAGIAALPVRDARPDRVAEIRARCLAALAQKPDRQAARRQTAGGWRFGAEATLATSLATLFLAATLERVLQILR